MSPELRSWKHSMLLMFVDCVVRLRRLEYKDANTAAMLAEFEYAASCMLEDLGGLAAAW